MEKQIGIRVSQWRWWPVAVALSTRLVVAADGGGAEAPVARPLAPEAAVVAPVATNNSQVISLTLDDVPLAEVVRLFTRISGANIIAATTNLQGQVTANLQDVAWKPAFESILERQNLQLIEKPPASGIYVIEARRTSEDPRVSTTVKLNYAKVADVSALVTSVLGKDGFVTPFAAANSIVISASAIKGAEVRKIVEELDRPRAQVAIETRILELTADTSKKLGINWGTTKGLVDHAVDFTAGMSYDKAVGTTPSEARVRGASLSPAEFGVTLSMLEAAGGGKTVSNPKVLVANEEKALIKMATDEPNLKTSITRASVVGQSDLTTTELDATRPYFTYGITMEVTPRINTASNITITIKPELSDKDTANSKTVGGNSFPAIMKKSVETIFSLGDGYTAAIGGLIKNTATDVDTKVPLLGDIPWLGEWLFAYKSRVNVQTETLIFVTVSIVDPQSNLERSQLPTESTLYQKNYPMKLAPTTTNTLANLLP